MVRYETSKRAIDLLGAAVGLVAAAPVLAITAVAIRVSMGAPVLFRQERPGFGGRPFTLLKFRTMRSTAASAARDSSDAARLTRLGRLLRASSLDELPQLLNVLRGELSLVGPRPLLMHYLPRYSQRQRRRHDVKPGITGWAQINGRNALSWDEKFELDLWYVDHRSTLLDCKILLRTVAAVLRREGIAHQGQATMPEFQGVVQDQDLNRSA